MGKGVVEEGASYEACPDCRAVCETTHGKDSAVPRFFKTIVEHSTPSSTNCHLQIPAAFIRTHIGLSKKDTYVVVGAPGCEWVMTFSVIGFKTGWKEFAVSYQLETGDGIMLSLFAPKRFYANVFDKFGIEKFSTTETRNRSKEHQVSNSMCGGGGGGDAGNQYNPLDSSGAHLHGGGKSNDSQHQTAGTSGQNVNPDDTVLLAEERRLLPGKPVDHEAEPSSMSPSSDDSEDSLQVRLAKAVLAKARQKRLKKRMKSSCTSGLQAAEGVITQVEGTTVGAANEACQNDDRRSDLNSADSPQRNDETPISGDVATFETPREDFSLLAHGGSSAIVEAVMRVPIAGKANELQAESEPRKVFQQEESPLLQVSPVAKGVPARRQSVPLSDRPVAEERPVPLFNPVLVKPEPDLSPYGNCNHCGKRKGAPILGRMLTPKPEPVTANSPSLDVRTPEARTPSSNPPRVTEAQKQRANAVASRLSKNTKNPNALVVGRVSMSKPDRCFLSNMCSEMLPPSPTELTLIDTEGNAQRVNWKPNQRIMDGPGWRDFVDSHNLHADDFWVMEVVESSENNVVVKAHIFHSHEMERSPERIVRAPLSKTPVVPAKTLPAVQAEATAAVSVKTPPVPVSPALRPVLGTRAPALGNGAKTRSSNQLHNSVASASKTKKRARAPDVDESAAQEERSPMPFHEAPTESPRPVASINGTEDGRALLELTRPKRPRRRWSSSSPVHTTNGSSTRPIADLRHPRRPSCCQVCQESEATSRPAAQPGQAKENRHGRSGGRPRRGGESASRVHANDAADEPAENPKQVRTRTSQRKTAYRVSKVIDRRKSLQGVVFLVELSERVRPESLQKRMRAQQDEKGRWWVPHHHFNHNLSACYLE